MTLKNPSSISLEEFNKKKHDFIIIDVREKIELDNVLENSINIPLSIILDSDEFNLKTYVSNIDENSNMFFYCAHGVRSEKVATIFKHMGFKNVFYFKGDFEELFNSLS